MPPHLLHFMVASPPIPSALINHNLGINPQKFNGVTLIPEEGGALWKKNLRACLKEERIVIERPLIENS